MNTTWTNGRLGNQIIRNLAVSLIAEKHDLSINYSNKESINKLGIDLFSGSTTHPNTINLTDDNYFFIYKSNNLNCNLDPNHHYFQTSAISNFLYNYLRTDKIQSKIVEMNPFKQRYNANNDLFVHIRLTDVAMYTPGLDYYANTIQSIQFDNLYISTDDANHPIVKALLSLHPTAKIVSCDEITTFQFASTNKHIVLSHGSFSAVIGYLAFFSDVYYPAYEPGKIWYGDMFSIENWKKIG